VNTFLNAYNQAFIEDIKCLQKSIISQQEKLREFVSEVDVVRALNVLNYIKYRNVADIFLGCASINLINAYTRQPESKLNYIYKMKLIDLLRSIKQISDENITLSYDNRFNMQLLIINFNIFQFSFQSARFSNLTKFLTKGNQIEWDGIRKQICAKTIFRFALENKYITNQTRKCKNLRDFLDTEETDYYNGYYIFDGGDLLKIWKFAIGEDNTDEYLKNYMRVKLAEPRNEPVILLGTYVKTCNKHITFVKVRPFITGIRTIPICDHVNLHRGTLEKYIDVNSLEQGNIYFIIGHCKLYNDGSGRMGVNLAENINSRPIFAKGNLRFVDKDVFEKCYKFSPEEYTMRLQKYIKL
jgi:hypothetical protein